MPGARREVATESPAIAVDRDGSISAARAVSRLARQIEKALAEVDLTMPQYRLLALLGTHPRGASVLAEHLAVSRPSVTAVVDGLVARSLIARRPDDFDRRRVEHELTPRGRELLDEADASCATRLERIAVHLDADSSRLAFGGLIAWGRGLDTGRDAKSSATTPPAQEER